MRRDDQARADRCARAPRHRRRRAQSVVFPDRRGLFRAARSPRFRRQLHRVDSPAHSPADRNQRMARDICAELHGAARRKTTAPISSTRFAKRCVPSSATATANGSPTMFASDSPPTSRTTDARALSSVASMRQYATGEMSIFRELTEGLPRQAPGSSAATLRALGLVRGLPTRRESSTSDAVPARRRSSWRAPPAAGSSQSISASDSSTN